MVSYQERWEQAMQNEKDSSTKNDHLRLDAYKNHPLFSCAYCDKTHSRKQCPYKTEEPVKEEKDEPYYNNSTYSWYE